MTRTMTKWITAGAILNFAAVLIAAVPVIELAPAQTAPVIDGKLDDPAWETAYTASEFKTFEPDYGKEPSQKTVVYILYDAENIYFAFRCFDTDPGKIKASISKRDAMFSDDFVGIVIDTFNTMQEGFGFIINPLGIQGDGMMNISGNLEGSHDMIWYSKGQIDDQGYMVECRIPLQSIRFPNKKKITMRLGFFRQLVRYSEMASSPPFYPDKGSIMAQSQPISFTGLKYKRVIEILPALTHSQRYGIDAGKLKRDERDSDISLTAKVGLTSDLTLDTTYNPDYSQVEADAGQVDVNLRYALFYPEKRPFFLEGNELFQFAGSTEDAPLAMVVHTRTIVDPLFGFKLTGKAGRKTTVAAIYAKDDLPGDDVDERPDFSILRFRYALKEDSYIGGFYTARDYGQGFNRVVGTDGRFRLTQASIASYHLFGSFTRGHGSEETAGGHALAAHYVYDNRKVSLDFGYQDVSQNFQVDTGFLTRSGVRRLALFGMYHFYPKSKLFQRIEPFYWSYHLYDTYDNMFETFNIFVLRVGLPRSTTVRLEGMLANEVYSGERFNRDGFGMRLESQLTKQFFLSLFYRRMGSIYYDPDEPYQGYGNRAGTTVQFQPTEKLDFIAALSYVDFYSESSREKIYDYAILRSFNTFQLNKYMFLRGIVEYNTYRKRLMLDTLISFTYIPGTVFYVGYGSAFQKLEWDGQDYVESDRFLETKRGFFFKVSYLWRL